MQILHQKEAWLSWQTFALLALLTEARTAETEKGIIERKRQWLIIKWETKVRETGAEQRQQHGGKLQLREACVICYSAISVATSNEHVAAAPLQPGMIHTQRGGNLQDVSLSRFDYFGKTKQTMTFIFFIYTLWWTTVATAAIFNHPTLLIMSNKALLVLQET